LKGERFDGHRFVADAVERGASCVVVHRAVGGTAQGATVVRVGDTLRALGDLAHYRRRKLAPKVVAITGSNGKTTTKEMAAAIFNEAVLNRQRLRGKVLKTEGNFNNLIGLPLTLLKLRAAHKIAVVEIGTNRPGEVQRLTEIAAPDVGIITAVAAAHLEGLDSLAGVAREKGALFRHLPRGGTIAVNLDDPWVRRLGSKFTGRKISYGARGMVRAESVRPVEARGTRFMLRAGTQRCSVRLRFLGRHNVSNAVGAAALARGLGVSLGAIRRGLEKARPYAMRMDTDSWRGVGIINDAYNANPASMAAALKTLACVGGKGEKIAVLGDMFELGRASRGEHRKLGKRAAEERIDRLYLLGPQAEVVKAGALSAGMDEAKIVIGESHGALARQLKNQLKKGDWLLVKGSRGMEMEKILRELKS
jgi:UDP-N-acetylmuramoyl-tripeptide--D-alanyl-D-alanine ligase